MPDGQNLERLYLSRIVSGVMNWGVWGHNLSPKEMLKLMNESIDLGITSFDHADIYGHYTTEETFGKALKMQPSLRGKMQLITKCGIKLTTPNRPNNKIKSYELGASYIVKSVEQSLRNLNTDYIDLLLIHRPSPLMNPFEIAEAFDLLRNMGKVRHFGVSNFTPSQFEMLNWHFPLVTNQVEASVLHTAPFFDGTFDQCLKHNVRPMVWSPLAGGKVFGDNLEQQPQMVQNVAARLAEEYDCELDQILLAFLLKHPTKIYPVVGTAKVERLQNAVEALDISLTTEEWFELLEAARDEEVA
jgi:predicted oxidoreductase